MTRQAPPVYHPQPVPRVLQKKTSRTGPTPVETPLTRAPRAAKQTTVQPKMASQQSKRPGAPPVYRPNPTPAVLQTKSAGKSNTNGHSRPTPATAVKKSAQNRTIQRQKKRHLVNSLPGATSVVQRAEKSGGGRSDLNAVVYSSVGKHYSAEEIRKAQQEALGKNLHGHRTGGSGSGVSQQTKTEMALVMDRLRENRAKEKEGKKKAVIKEKAKMSGFERAKRKAQEILAASGSDGLGDMLEYLDRREEELALTKHERDEVLLLFGVPPEEEYDSGSDVGHANIAVTPSAAIVMSGEELLFATLAGFSNPSMLGAWRESDAYQWYAEAAAAGPMSAHDKALLIARIKSARG